MRELVVVRHGEAEGNALGIAQGRRPYPLTRLGRGHAHAVARVVDGLGWSPTHVVSSPVRRCVETATVIAADLNAPAAVLDDAFTEIDCGMATGRRFADLEVEYPELFARPPSEWLGFGAVGGEDDESVHARVAAGLDRMPRDQRVLLVTHGAVFKAVLKHLLGFSAPYFLDIRCGTCLRVERRQIAGADVMAFTHYLHAEEWPARKVSAGGAGD